jgi:ParB family chromosome partitioning protein
MASKFNLNQLMSDQSKSESGRPAIAFKIELIPLEKIKPSTMNKYSMDDITELKASIEYSGLQQNLLVRQCDGGNMYEIISGHRRYKALKELHATGNEEYSRIPCKIIKTADDIQAELQLIFANSTARRLTDYEVTYQAGRLRDLLTKLKNGDYKITGRKREIVAEMLGVSAAQVGRMESINNNLLPELKEEFKRENIGITAAYELSRLDSNRQEKALQEHKNGASLTPEKAKRHKEKPHMEEQPEAAQERPSCPPQYCGTYISGDCIHHQREEIIPTHQLKTYPDVFHAVRGGLKTFEYRLNDRNYQTGDILRLCEYIPDMSGYSGEYVDVEVKYKLAGGEFGIPAEYVIMSIVVI